MASAAARLPDPPPCFETGFGPRQHEIYCIVSVGKPHPEEGRRPVSTGGPFGRTGAGAGFLVRRPAAFSATRVARLPAARSEECRVGEGGVRTGNCRGRAVHIK